MANFKLLISFKDSPDSGEDTRMEIISSLAFAAGSTGILEWEATIPTETKVLGVADEFIDLSHHRSDDSGTQEIWFPDEATALAFQAEIHEKYPGAELSEVLLEEDQDWMRLWRQHYTVQEIPLEDSKFFIVPAWMEPPTEALENCYIKLQPGQAFGAGTHATTRLCLQAALKIFKDYPALRSIQDFGAGTGVLAISVLAMAKLNEYSLLAQAIEIEDEARELCLRNAELNSVDLPTIKFAAPDEKYDLTIANVLAPVLLEHKDYLWRSTNPDGYIVLSGLLKEEVDDFKIDFIAEFNERIIDSEIFIDGDWAALVLKVK